MKQLEETQYRFKAAIAAYEPAEDIEICFSAKTPRQAIARASKEWKRLTDSSSCVIFHGLEKIQKVVWRPVQQ